ncbi:calcium-binding protein P-like isoform X2 [Homarus americanus]|uniref:calcium-binding protein P-like isoform X2 n=1 Tax=Homarus americanus TaxID=6706 RepID=UPI001C4915DD|nr:calcium-binding protein P-like isoform X2 [Homarus americanus]
MNSNAYQPAPGSTYTVRPTNNYVRQGLKIGSLVVGFPLIICLGIFGGFFLLSGIMVMSVTTDFSDFKSSSLFDDDDDDDFGLPSEPGYGIGIFMMIIGILLIVACVSACYYTRKNYNAFNNHGNPGRVINQNPAQPVTTYPGQPVTTYPGQPVTTYPGQPATTYPGQPVTMYPGQPAATYPGQSVATYPAQPAGAPYMTQPMAYPTPQQPGQMIVNYQMIPPGQTPPQGPPSGTSYPSASAPMTGPSGVQAAPPPYGAPSSVDYAGPLPEKGNLQHGGALPGAPEYQSPPPYAPDSNPPPYSP